eukprot:210447-Chlamydomonas_euryale.AAC.1
MAAIGRPRWKPRSVCSADSKRSSSARRLSWSIWACFACRRKGPRMGCAVFEVAMSGPRRVWGSGLWGV